jgi:peptidoglycan/LPS O-acetylase OafA/YrhL
LLVGCLLALLAGNPEFRSNAQRWSRYYAPVSLVVFVACIWYFHRLPPLLECLAIACLIGASSLNPGSLFVRPLLFAPLEWLGTISYSVYVWQQFFLAHHQPGAIYFFMGLLPLFALGSYYWIERPFNRLGHRLTRGTRETVGKQIAQAAGESDSPAQVAI